MINLTLNNLLLIARCSQGICLAAQMYGMIETYKNYG